jgi:uncharacterized protein
MTLHAHNFPSQTCDLETLRALVDTAARAIPPAWPLASNVAVNPYLGQAHDSLALTGARLQRVAGLPITMPRTWYRNQLNANILTDQDLAAALAANPDMAGTLDVAALKAATQSDTPIQAAIPTIAQLAQKASGIDWPELIGERFGAWCGSWLDQGQALWAAPQGLSAYRAWRTFAINDLSPEIAGLKGFSARVTFTSVNAITALSEFSTQIGLPEAAMPTYFHSLLMDLGGWAQAGRYRLWQAELAGSTDSTIADFLTIRAIWEIALLEQYHAQIGDQWQAVCAAHSAPVVPDADLIIDQLLQEAAERAGQRGIALALSAPSGEALDSRPPLQAAFCIDVRSEVFRRALEGVNPSIQTLGFAGFFGLTASHKRFASDVDELRLPVLLNPGVHSCSGDAKDAPADQSARLTARAARAWGRFKLAAVSSFAFVEASGPLYIGKLIKDGLGLNKVSPPHDPAPRLDPALDLPARITAATSVLRAMSLTGPFARLVVLAGHGASVTNNPYASALQCGACGGYSGEVNARLLAALLNDPDVREGLKANDIEIPNDTLFLGGLHDTTNDIIKLYDTDHDTTTHAGDLQLARKWFAAAGTMTRTERAIRLPGAAGEAALGGRGVDWAQVRPEWALAGCKAFIAAPRLRTKGKNLEGRAFLHDYDWRADTGFGVLELIMTAPVVVASWISLQYYGSTVAPQFFGAGNKLLHNVVGGIGVVEGNGGVLRTGLPLQSVHDGDRFIHDPLRLSVCIEAPIHAMTDILARHDGVRALFDNKWLSLHALSENGQIAHRYVGDLKWEVWS